MKLHIANGFKAARDRAVLINSYHVMCKDFRIPKDRRLDDADLARLSNEMLFKLNSDLYSQATVKQAKRLAVKMGLIESPARKIINRIKDWFIYTFHDDHFHKEAARAKS
jgi:hypothetical protein